MNRMNKKTVSIMLFLYIIKNSINEFIQFTNKTPNKILSFDLKH